MRIESILFLVNLGGAIYASPVHDRDEDTAASMSVEV